MWKSHVDRDATAKMIKDNRARWTGERRAIDCSLDRRLLRDRATKLASNCSAIDFKCFERWLTSFSTGYGFLPNTDEFSRSIFNNYRFWSDIMRSVIMPYQNEDLFHLDELTMYSDVSPGEVASTIQRDEYGAMKKTTVLMCCNASGTEKLPLLICGSYPAVMTTGEDHVYSHSEDASINDGLFKEWLIRLNDRISSGKRKILLLLHRKRSRAFRNLVLSNVEQIFLPDDFPLRPLKTGIFRFVKMFYRTRYVEGIGERRRRWSVENVVRSLVEAWRKVPRDLIIASFQGTRFRIDDYFVKIRRDAWKDLETGLSFKKFVTFDDDLSPNVSHKRRKSIGKNHSYNLRSKNIIESIDDDLDSAFNPRKKKNSIDRCSRMNQNPKKKKSAKEKDWKRKSSLKRSRDKARLDEDGETNGAKANGESISNNDRDIVAISTPAKLPKIVDIQTIEIAAQNSKSKLHSVRTIARTNMNCARKIDKTANNEKKRENKRDSSNGRSIGSPSEIDNVNGIVSQQVSDDDAFAVDSGTKEQQATRAIHRVASNDESIDLNENDGQKSLKRRRTASNIEEFQNKCNDDEPKRKRSRCDSNWTKQYETTFVFGTSDLTRTASTVFDTFSDDEVRQPRSRRSCETERSIFTISPKKD